MDTPKFNIDKVSDDQYFAVTEALALAGECFSNDGPETVLIVSLCADDRKSAILGGEVTPERLTALRGLIDEMLERAQTEEPDGDALLLHLEHEPNQADSH